jgi:phospholipid-binding lipoprotein MlaA
MFKRLSFYCLIIIVTGCASTGDNKQDPWEGWNRGVYQFNKSIDNTIAKPLTKGYKAITPDFVETGVSNVYSNLNDVPTSLNSLLQGKVIDSFSDLGRFIINSTIGVAGLWDPASSIGLEKHDEDFGQTLGAWGVGSGPYIMLPFLGPSTLRDTAAYPVNSEVDLISQIEHIPTRNQAKVLELIDKRSTLLEYDDLLKDAIDEYAFIRDTYLQNRKYKVLDGDIPFEEECEGEQEDCDF